MKRTATRLATVCLITFLSSLSLSQTITSHPLFGGRDPLAAPARVRAELAKRGLSPMGRGHLSPVLLQQRKHIAPGEYNIKFAVGANARIQRSLNGAAHAKVISVLPHVNIETIRVPDSALELYRKNPNVLWIEANPMRYPLLNDPNDFAYNNYDYNLPLDPLNATWFKWDAHFLQAVDGWSIWPGQYFTSAGKGTAGVTIAIIDTGVDYSHPDFRNAGGSTTNVTGGGQLYRSLDRTILSGIYTQDASDAFGHGTHVTGIAAAGTNNVSGTTGNGYVSNVISLRVTDANGNGTASDLAKAIIYAADNGAVVTNVSLGDYTYSKAEQDAVNYAWGKGMLVIAAAGNDGGSGFPPPTIYPAALSSVLAVSATTRDDNLASYASFGDWVGIGAPGGDWDFNIEWFLGIWSTTPTYFVTLNDPAYGIANNYDYLMGSSMAAPQVTGTAANYAGMLGYHSATPGAPLAIWQALQRGADGGGGWDPYAGWGRLNIYNTMNLGTVPNPRGDTVGGITGQIRYKGTPVANADVVAVQNGSAFSGTSRGDGGYRIPNIPPGTYDLTATYFGEVQTIIGVNVTIGCDMPGIDFNIGAGTLSSLTISPSLVAGGVSSTGTVTLVSPAPAGGRVVQLFSNSPSVAVPAVASITIPAGSLSGTFAINTYSVTSSTVVTISATCNGDLKSALITVAPPTISSLTISPNSVVGTASSTGTVTLNTAAPNGGIVVALSSNNPAATPAVNSVTVAAGSTSAMFNINTTAVSTSTVVAITGTANGGSASGNITVNPPSLSTLTISPNSVVGPTGTTGTVTLDAVAPTGGWMVALSSNNAAAVPAVSSVTVPAGSTSATFAINTTVVSVVTVVTMTGAANGITKSANVTVNPVGLSSITIAPNPIVGPNTATGTVKLAAAAPGGGVVVNVASNNNVVAAPMVNTVSIPGGATSATFSINVSAVAVNTNVTFSATLGSVTKTTILSVRSIAKMSSISASPNPVAGSLNSKGTVRLDAAAPVGGSVVTLGTDNAAVANPAVSTITVPAGSSSATFTINTSVVYANTIVNISGSSGGVTKSVALTVRPISVLSLTVSPSTVVGSKTVTGTVKLEAPAPVGDIVVNLSSSDPTVAYPTVTSITIPAGSASGTFTINTNAVTVDTSVTLTASANGLSKTAKLTVRRIGVLFINLAPNPVVAPTTVTGTITLEAPAGPGSVVVALSSSNPAVANPAVASITIPAGQVTGTFLVNTVHPAAQTIVAISGTAGGITKSRNLTVN